MSRPIPIAVLMTSFEPGGTERQMIELVRRLDRSRWAVHVPCFHSRGAWFGRVLEAAASVVEFPITTFQSTSALKHVRAFARWCDAFQIAIVHTTELYANIFGLPGAALAGVPVRIGNRREINPDKSPAQIAMQRVAYSFAHKVVANSRAAADRLRLERVPARKITVIPNGLDLDTIQPAAHRPRLRKVTIVANLRPEKGHDVLMDAAVMTLRRFPDATFDCVGHGSELSVLVARAKRLGLTRAFTFLGHQDDVATRLAEADLFVLPSRSEAFPNSVLEAMAAGLPIVASGVGGILELIDSGRTGLLVPPGEPRPLADALCRLMEDPALAARLGDAARDEARAHYPFDRMVASFESLYLSELTRRGVVAAREPQWAAS
jgi:glycosyltransferase involved in cell wall biosynthesis